MVGEARQRQGGSAPSIQGSGERFTSDIVVVLCPIIPFGVIHESLQCKCRLRQEEGEGGDNLSSSSCGLALASTKLPVYRMDAENKSAVQG